MSYRVIYNGILNVFIVGAIVLEMQLVNVGKVILPAFIMNFIIAYVTACAVGVFFKIEKSGMALTKMLDVDKDHFLYQAIFNLPISAIFSLVLSVVMSIFNVVIILQLGAIPLVFAILRGFIPAFAVGYILVIFLSAPCHGWTRKLLKH